MTTKSNKTVLRQLEFPMDVYQEAEEVMAIENKRLGLVTRKEKINLKGFLPELVADGIDFRKGEVYVPRDLNLTQDAQEALVDAEEAIQKFNKLIS